MALASSGVSAPALPSAMRRFEMARPPAPGRYSTIHVMTPDGITFRPYPFRSASYQKLVVLPGLMPSSARFVSLIVGMFERPSRFW